MSIVLSVKGLSKSFGGLQAVNDVHFDVNSGEILAMIGPNGAGKSTCFNMLMGQLKPSRGTATFRGRNLPAMKTPDIWRLGVGRTFQITATYASMTVIENVQMALLSQHKKVFSIRRYAHAMYRDEACQMLSMVGLENQAERHCAVLAYGDLKRLELAVALAHNPRLLLMDEPTAGMALEERSELMQLTTDIVHQRGISILFTEHDMDVVFNHAHRIVVLNRGELIAEGSAETIRNNPLVQEVYLGSTQTQHVEDKHTA